MFDAASDVLVVDNSTRIQRQMCEILAPYCAQVRFVGNCDAGRVALADRAPDVLFVGLESSDAAGLGLLAAAAALEPAVPVVVLGARLAVEDLVAAVRTGACDVVFKPPSPAAVLSAYQRARRRHSQRAPVAERPGLTPPAPAPGPPPDDRRWHWHPPLLERRETSVTIPLVGDYELVEEQLVEQVVGRYAGNKAAAARALGMHRRTLYRVLERRTKRPAEPESRAAESNGISN